MNRTSINFLIELLREESLPASRASATVRRDIRPLLEMDAVVSRKAGAGVRLHLADRTAVEGTVKRYRPGYGAGEPELPARAEAVFHRRDSKQAKGEGPYVLVMRAHGNSLFRAGEREFAPAEFTKEFGVASLAVEPGDEWRTQESVALVENKEVFFHSRSLVRRTGCRVFIYYAGHLDEGLIEWLCTRPRAARLVLLPDYDPVGLNNYMRLKSRLADPPELYVPPNLDALMRMHGKPELLHKQLSYVQELKTRGDELVQRLLFLMQKHGCGLEQEALLFQV